MSVGFILAAASLVALFMAQHSFLTYPLSLRLMLPWRKRSPLPAAPHAIEPATAENLKYKARHSFALCLCAYNEEAVIEKKVLNMLAMRDHVGSLQILVYVDCASDRTLEILRRFDSEITIVASPQRNGKTYGTNLLVSMANADIVIFTDANVIIDLHAIEAFDRSFADATVGLVCGKLIYTNPDASETAATGARYWRLEESIKELETAFGSVITSDGALFALRRSLHRPVPVALSDDFYLSIDILCEGHKVITAPDALAWEQSVTRSSEEFRRKVRIACLAFSGHRSLAPKLRKLSALRKYMYLSHKWLRWTAGFSLSASMLLAMAALVAFGLPPLLVTGSFGFGVALMWLGYVFGMGPICSVVEILSAFAGTAFGLILAMRGKSFQTWSPATSIRTETAFESHTATNYDPAPEGANDKIIIGLCPSVQHPRS